MASDTFKWDKRIGSQEKESPSGSALNHIGKGLNSLFFKRFYMNLFIVLLIIAASAVLIYKLPGQMVTGNAIVGCPDITCPACEECVCEKQDCPALDCSDCEEMIKTEYIYRYRCPSGAIVNNSGDCIGGFPETNPTYTSASNGVSLSLDSVYYEKEGDTIRIKQINYTILNRGSTSILPKVGLKLYEKYTYEAKEAEYLRAFKLDRVLDVGDWVKKSENTNLDFKGSERTIRLELIDALPDPDENLVAVYRKIDFS